MPNFVDLSGKKFGRLTVVSRAINKGQRTAWSCVCECGSTSVVISKHLVSGHTKSCGCLHVDRAATINYAHGHSRKTADRQRSKEYSTWRSMRTRCNNKNAKDYPRYGGRGIAVCERWNSSFEAFLQDMGEAPSPDHSIDRIDNSANYSKENCRWANKKEQARNKRTSRLLTVGNRTATLVEWSEISGVHPRTITDRIDHGWATQDAIFTHPKHQSSRP